jgi:DNA adenine methylase
MTTYHGGKQRLGLTIANVITDEVLDRVDDGFELKGYCEPFCGMLGVYQHIPELFEPEGCEEESIGNIKYLAGDRNGSVIKMWQAAQRGWKPPTTCSETKYNRIKNSKGDSALKGFIGHECSFGGQFFQGYVNKYDCKKNPKKASQKVSNIANRLQFVNFKSVNYINYSNLKNYVIYCDPPYFNTKCQYSNNFINADFWHWCLQMSKNNIVFISEYKIPTELKMNVDCVYSKQSVSNSVTGKKCTGIEKLFCFK